MWRWCQMVETPYGVLSTISDVTLSPSVHDDCASDGSPVELYRRLSARADEGALNHTLLPTGATVLDLGCGTGRLAEPLVRLGHPVTGVDNRPEMLAALRLATPVCANITMIDLNTGIAG
jgi:2-polyprenyl-3-methyl-5-hydroxy-6-metoxy-1,4-benzoquinol methylase